MGSELPSLWEDPAQPIAVSMPALAPKELRATDFQEELVARKGIVILKEEPLAVSM